MEFFRTLQGLRVSLIVWATLLVADGVLLIVEPAQWRQHLVIAAAPAFGLVTTAIRLRVKASATDHLEAN